MRIKNTFLSLLILFQLLPIAAQQDSVFLQIKSRLESIPEVVVVNKLKNTDHFTNCFEIYFEQHVNPLDTSSATFNQRVLLGHKDFVAPVIVNLEGYQIWTGYSGELTTLYEGNQLTIEHRFFASSTPSGGIPWEFLTVENAANDQHRIIERIKSTLYPNQKFVSTGISKGGQTTMLHRSMYPEDVDASVCYVAPLNFEKEDPRIYTFLDNVGTQEQRDKIRDFQLLCLNNKKKLTKLLDKRAQDYNYHWDFSTEKALEYYVLEYSFAFWQWGGVEFEDIPTSDAKSDAILDHLLAVSGISFFEQSGVEELRSYFWAALTQEGIYGYRYEPFAEYLSQQEDYTFDFAFPEGIYLDFDPNPMSKLNNFIQEEATEILFIYGELDTWSATGVNLSEHAKDRGLKKYVLEGGHHGTRINDFPEEIQNEIKTQLDDWLNIN